MDLENLENLENKKIKYEKKGRPLGRKSHYTLYNYEVDLGDGVKHKCTNIEQIATLTGMSHSCVTKRIRGETKGIYQSQRLKEKNNIKIERTKIKT